MTMLPMYRIGKIPLKDIGNIFS